MSNIINAIINLVENPKLQLKQYALNHNRANNMGESLEEYIKDLFANTVDETNTIKRNERLSNVFSYLGNQNNPPDMMIRNGDAIEVKKIESDDSNLALNIPLNAKNLQFFSPSLFVLDVFQELLSRNNCNFYALSGIVVIQKQNYMQTIQ